MKLIFSTCKFLGVAILLALAVGCMSTQSKENLLAAAGFKVIVPTTPAQEAKLKTLAAGKVSRVQKDGKTYYVFPDVAHNQAYVGGTKQYQAYQQLRQEAVANRQIAAMDRDNQLIEQEAGNDWEAWGGWGAWAGDWGEEAN